MRTARTWGKPPSLWWGRSGKRWTDQDRLLTLALTSYEDSLCSCGQPKDVVYNPDADGWFEAQEIVCAGCAAIQQHGKDQKRPTPGGKVYAVDTRPPEVELKPWRLPSRPDDQPAHEQADA